MLCEQDIRQAVDLERIKLEASQIGANPGKGESANRTIIWICDITFMNLKLKCDYLYHVRLKWCHCLFLHRTIYDAYDLWNYFTFKETTYQA